jgi:hypothetical protein
MEVSMALTTVCFVTEKTNDQKVGELFKVWPTVYHLDAAIADIS